jgi:hypothetical protein
MQAEFVAQMKGDDEKDDDDWYRRGHCGTMRGTTLAGVPNGLGVAITNKRKSGLQPWSDPGLFLFASPGSSRAARC